MRFSGSWLHKVLIRIEAIDKFRVMKMSRQRTKGSLGTYTFTYQD